MGDFDYTFTVFTPTYNRAHTLGRLYESLKKQNFRDFEWLVVDHGSDDNTRELIRDWQQEADFDIRYEIQETLGKHHNHNRALELARGELLWVVDSDDELLSDALETLYQTWEGIDKSMRDQYGGVNAHCVDSNGEVVGDLYPEDEFDSDHLQNRYKYDVDGQKAGFIRTQVAREYPFPEYTHIKRVPENIVWDKIAADYTFRCVNEPVLIYHSDIEGGQITTRDPEESAPEMILYHEHVLNNNIEEYFQYSPMSFVKSAGNYIRFTLYTEGNLSEKFKRLDPLLSRVLFVLCLPLGLAMYLYDRTA